MRKADIATAVRIALIPVIAYAVLLKLDPIVPVAIFIVVLALDGVDGFLALNEASSGRIGIATYLGYALGGIDAAKLVEKYKPKMAKEAHNGPRIDIAGDRILEYSLWMLFIYVKLLPFFVILLIIGRHSLADALMGSKGTSAKSKTKFARMLYSSKGSRLVANVLKALAFSYLMLVYISGWNLYVGYALAAMLVTFVMLRGAAEIYESVSA
jgi:phosphatidylglycerophosphate synthase